MYGANDLDDDDPAGGTRTGRLLVAALMAFGTYLFVTVLLIAAIGTLVVVGAWMLPEAVLLVRRIAGARRRQGRGMGVLGRGACFT
ncbi:hypothetical protein OHU34_21235 [Streptomyces sp. NBC_00080]|uniref:hypothetical protein n=1 Tax=unclassified Streptomyces TaxID=2593676 RepID=UPI00116D2CBB|nr:hypothetical protein [Streptomyces sp. SLBN-115]TQJ54306.1 hypothetical protein FBY34_2076 [Streptomyces sp. SLBN-115]